MKKMKKQNISKKNEKNKVKQFSDKMAAKGRMTGCEAPHNNI